MKSARKTLIVILVLLLALLLPLASVSASAIHPARVSQAEPFDPSSVAVGGIQLMILLFGLVEFLKTSFNWQGKTVTFVSFALGIVLFGAFNLELFLPGAGPWVAFGAQALTTGLAASGYYRFIAKRTPAVDEQRTG